MPATPAIYARISQDRGGEGLGTQRQLADCRAEAERRGWPAPVEYVDDDTSAYSGKVRPQYRAMLDAIRAGDVDAVVVWHMDRLHRRPIELEEFADTCTRAGVKDVVTLHGEFDLGSGDGLLVARLMAAVAANESDAKSRRTKRKQRELAERGLPSGGGMRPFGFTPDRLHLDEAEAATIRTLASRLLAGEPLVSLVRWLQDSDIHTVTGKEWRTTTVRNLLLSPRIAGLREHQGQVIGKAAWPAIITEEDHARIVALLKDPARRTNRSARAYLLSGLLRCGKCGSKMVTGRSRDRRRYMCRTGPDFGGCGGTMISASVEELVAEAVLYRLDTPELAAAIDGQQRKDENSAALSESIAADAAQLEELAGLYAAKAITGPEWVTARTAIDARLKANRARQASQAGSTALAGHIGNASALRREWPQTNLSRQVPIVRALISHITIHPGTPGVRTIDPARVGITWRV
ncbi:recombinase family protein [Phycicoccus sp. MAQZ13P-2]|uniref:recombinase family protein n=1 Tax=Phycicoccus mangrovi TaxID=2840470 RepID=UPI001BFFE758|nr:recombinase family protein [Phycicoccus mangrovi]MBT9255865.1 recombinase family protein [Phycicoccus mangrovi]MBT9274459.1 recombinase family protein [Phycicoccus mangrovi]